MLCNYADDTYLIVQSCNADTRSAELSNEETSWNVKLNQTKSVEVVFTDHKRI